MQNDPSWTTRPYLLPDRSIKEVREANAPFIKVILPQIAYARTGKFTENNTKSSRAGDYSRRQPKIRNSINKTDEPINQ